MAVLATGRDQRNNLSIYRLIEQRPEFNSSLLIRHLHRCRGEQNYVALTLHLNHLAMVLYATNRLAEADPLYHRALAIDEVSYGPQHPNVAPVLNNLAELLRATAS